MGGLNEVGDWVGERITRGGALIIAFIKHVREIMGLIDVIGERSVGKRIVKGGERGKRWIDVRVERGREGKVREVWGELLVREWEVLRDSVGIVDYVRRRCEEIVMLVDNIGVVESVKRQVGYNRRDVVSVVDEVRRGAVKCVGDVICVSEEVGREVVKRVRDVMRS